MAKETELRCYKSLLNYVLTRARGTTNLCHKAMGAQNCSPLMIKNIKKLVTCLLGDKCDKHGRN